MAKACGLKGVKVSSVQELEEAGKISGNPWCPRNGCDGCKINLYTKVVATQIFRIFSPRKLGKWSNLTFIFFKWVETQPPTSIYTCAFGSFLLVCGLVMFFLGCFFVEALKTAIEGQMQRKETTLVEILLNQAGMWRQKKTAGWSLLNGGFKWREFPPPPKSL